MGAMMAGRAEQGIGDPLTVATSAAILAQISSSPSKARTTAMYAPICGNLAVGCDAVCGITSSSALRRCMCHAAVSLVGHTFGDILVNRSSTLHGWFPALE